MGPGYKIQHKGMAKVILSHSPALDPVTFLKTSSNWKKSPKLTLERKLLEKMEMKNYLTISICEQLKCWLPKDRERHKCK